MDIEQSIIVRTPLQDVFTYLSNIRNHKDYKLETQEIIPITKETIQKGLTYLEKSTFLGLKWKRNFEVTDFEPNSQITASANLGNLPLEQRFKLHKVSEGTLIKWKVSMKPKGYMKILSPLIKLKMKNQLKKDIEQLKEVLTYQLSNAFFLTYSDENKVAWV